MCYLITDSNSSHCKAFRNKALCRVFQDVNTRNTLRYGFNCIFGTFDFFDKKIFYIHNCFL